MRSILKSARSLVFRSQCKGRARTWSRCIPRIESLENRLVLTPPTVAVWTGGDPTDPNDWGTAANWTPKAVPDSNTYVVIPPGTLKCEVEEPSNCAKVTIQSGAATGANDGELWLYDFLGVSGNVSVSGFLNLKGGGLGVQTLTINDGCSRRGSSQCKHHG